MEMVLHVAGNCYVSVLVFCVWNWMPLGLCKHRVDLTWIFGTGNQVRKNSLNIKFLGGIFLGHPGPRRRDIPDKNFMQVAFFCCFRQGVAGMSRDLGRDVPDLEKLYARKLWADFSHPRLKESTPVSGTKSTP